VIYGGAGTIGRAVARAFAREGAHIHLAGRTAATLEEVAKSIRAAGGAADTAVVDALDERAVDEHADAVAATGGLHISFNLIDIRDVQGTPMTAMRVDDYMRPVETAVRTSFITWRAAARHMVRQGSGVILAFGGEGDPPRGYSLGGLQTAFHAIEAMRRQLSAELGRDGVRVVTLRTSGIAESLPRDMDGRDQIAAGIDASTMLGRAATLEDVGNAAVFAASDWGRSLTAAAINISCGTFAD
jgi:3-oxoacyl-[acyl-carrier protein] reductase